MFTTSTLFRSLLTLPFVSRIRRNHGLEHATLNILGQKYPRLKMAGHSDIGGFWLIGDVPIETMHQAVEEALLRLRNGEHGLAVHPICGTNFVAAGIAAGALGWLSMIGVGDRLRDKLERLPLTMVLTTLAMIWAYPIGFVLQARLTASGNPEGLEVVEIMRGERGRFNAFRVTTRG